MVQQPVLLLFHFIHVTAVITWIGAHFFQLFTLDPALKLTGRYTEVSTLNKVFPRFNQVTGTAAVLTLSSGTALAMLKTQASVLPMITTVWGILLLAGLVLVLVILFAHPKPNQIRILSNVSIVLLLGSLAFALERTRGDLSVFITTLWGQSIMVGAIAGLGIFLLGFVMGQHRVMIAIQGQKLLESQKIDESSAEFREFSRLRRRLYILSVPENILTVIVLAAMISAGYLPG
ncbi:MAG: hypothetical protein RMK31_06970 [Candidatus Caldarchaeum sp.]|nr:hypothetical protein [Candidatus Caldarchaeum sp.]